MIFASCTTEIGCVSFDENYQARILWVRNTILKSVEKATVQFRTNSSDSNEWKNIYEYNEDDDGSVTCSEFSLEDQGNGKLKIWVHNAPLLSKDYGKTWIRSK